MICRTHAACLPVLLIAAGCAKNPEKGTTAATDDGTTGTTTEEPVEPLLFEMTAPTSGAIVDADSVTAEGSWSGGLDTVVTVNGVVIDQEGDFSLESSHSDVLWPDSPLWPVLGDAHDQEGTWARARATLIQGAAAPANAPIEDGLMFRLTDNVLDQLSASLDTLTAELDLESLLVSEDPVTSVAGIDLFVNGVSYGDLLPGLDFTGSGLSYSLRVEAVSLDIFIDAGILGDYDTELAADAIIVSGDMVFGVDGAGGLTVTASNTAVATENLELFGFTDRFGLVDSLLGDTIAVEVESVIVDALGGLLEAQESLRSLEFSGLLIESDFVNAIHDPDGVTILADSRLALSEGGDLGDRLSTDEAWSLPTGKDSPSGTPYQAGLYLDDDLISALGAGLAATDLLTQEIAGDDLGSFSLDTSLLGTIIPGFDTLPSGQPVSLRTRPTTVPVGQAGREGFAGELHLGGLELDLLTDADGDGTDDVVMVVALDAIVGLAPGAEGELFAIDLIDSQATLLSTTLGSGPDEVEPGLANLIDLAVPLLVGDLLGDALTFDLGGAELSVVDGAGVGDRAALFLDVDLSGLEL